MKKDIIPQVPEDKRATWVEAADTWRLPYWDWAAHPEAPKLASRPLVTVTMPNGGTTEMDNPLYQFRMPNDKLMGTEGVESKGGVDVSSGRETMTRWLQRPRQGLKRQLSR